MAEEPRRNDDPVPKFGIRPPEEGEVPGEVPDVPDGKEDAPGEEAKPTEDGKMLGEVPDVPDGEKDAPDADAKPTPKGKEPKIPARFLESADALNLPERSREAYLKMLVTATNIDGGISWETIEAAGYKVPYTDQKAIAKAIREEYGFSRTMSFVRKLVKEEKEGSDKGEPAPPSGNEPGAVPEVPDGKKDAPDADAKPTPKGKETEIPARFLESADALNLPKRSREAYLKMLITATNIDGEISWETIEAAGYKAPRTDQKAIAKAIREVYGLSRTMSMVKKLVKEEEGASKGEPAPPNGDEDKPTPPDGAEPKKVFSFTCVRTGEKEFDTTSLCEYEERLNSIDKQISLRDRVKEVFETIKESACIATDGAEWMRAINLVVIAMQMPTIDWKAPIWKKKCYDKHELMRKRLIILKLFKNKFEKLHVPYEDVTLKNILCDLRNMIMTEDEIKALAE